MRSKLTIEQIAQIREKYREIYKEDCDCSNLWIELVFEDTCVTTYALREFRNRIERCIAEVLGTWEF